MHAFSKDQKPAMPALTPTYYRLVLSSVYMCPHSSIVSCMYADTSIWRADAAESAGIVS